MTLFQLPGLRTVKWYYDVNAELVRMLEGSWPILIK